MDYSACRSKGRRCRAHLHTKITDRGAEVRAMALDLSGETSIVNAAKTVKYLLNVLEVLLSIVV